MSDVKVEAKDIEYNNGSSQHISYPVNTDNYHIEFERQSAAEEWFRYVKELLLQFHNYEMYKAYINLKENNANIYSVKTDAFVIREKDVEPAGKLLNFSDEIGGWRVSKYDEEIKFPTMIYEVVESELINIPAYKSQELPVKNEYDTDSIIEQIKLNNPMMIRGELPGTGKSYICQNMVEKDYKVMFVCPAKKLLQGFEGETLIIQISFLEYLLVM